MFTNKLFKINKTNMRTIRDILCLPFMALWMVTILQGKSFWVKFLRVKGRTSLQSHSKRTEWHFGLYKVPIGEKHRIAHGWFIELATGTPTEEDIIRYEDDYGREICG